jgi:hypothetical protein
VKEHEIYLDALCVCNAYIWMCNVCITLDLDTCNEYNTCIITIITRLLDNNRILSLLSIIFDGNRLLSIIIDYHQFIIIR